VANLEVAGEAALARDGNVIAQLCGAGDADLGDEQAVLPDLHVVADLHKIINLGPLAYHRFAQGGAIDRGAGADFNVIFNSDNSNLRNLVVLALVQGEPVAVRTDHDASMNDAAAPNTRPIINHNIRINDAVIANSRTGFNRDRLKNDDVISDYDVLTDRRERPHCHIRSELCARRHAGL
jgi:hypothetical protein